MDKETYKALKKVINIIINLNLMSEDNIQWFALKKEIKQIENWIDEVAKDYTDKDL